MRLRSVIAAALVATAAALGAFAVEPRPVARAAEAFPAGQDGVDPRSADRAMRAEMRELAGAWADGGGTFGYPFWQKAAQRWRRGEINPAMFREYVTGYRDRLELGCDLLEDIDTEVEVSGRVADLVEDSCRARLDALREQQRGLDAAIRGARGGEVTDVEELEATIAEHEAKAAENLQESFRDTRLAMDLAQSALDEAGLPRLREDAFL